MFQIGAARALKKEAEMGLGAVQLKHLTIIS